MDDSGAAMSFGLMSALRTGNVVTDMAVCMMVPLVMKGLFEAVTNYLPYVFKLVMKLLSSKKQNECIRNIEVCKRTVGRSMIGHKDTRNELLQKAVQMYVGSLKLNYEECDCRLKTIKDQNPWDIAGSTFEQLEKYHIVRLPAEGTWCEVQEGIEFKYDLEVTEEGEGSRSTKNNTMRSLYQFRCYDADAEAKIDSFIGRCFDHYKEEMRKLESSGRFMYTLAPSMSKSAGQDEEGQDTAEAYAYRRYKLSGEKTFDSWFNVEKAGVLKLVDSFVAKEGKFGVKGFPHKLGLLLHGPPGTGKTSFIKCIAEYTSRHIVNIPLARIKTNQELMDIVFDMRYKVDDEDLPVRLNFNEIVFVMEDIDCASDIVCTRDGKRSGKEEAAMLTRELTEEVEMGELAGPLPQSGSSVGEICDISVGGEKKKKSGYKDKHTNDKLNLSGLLNVLDGVVDTPGRILIMTTNHPEKLDPALIRPGRVNKRLFLGYMRPEDISAMVTRYFPGHSLTPAQEKLLPTERFTPAEMEQFCAEAETLNELMALIEKVLSNQPKHVKNPIRFE